MKKRKYTQERMNPEMVLKRNWKIILIVGLLCFIPLTILTLKKEKKYYTAVVSLRVEAVTSSGMGNGADSILSYYKEYIGTQNYKILKKKNVERALKDLTNEELLSFTGRNKVDDIAIAIATNSITIEQVKMTQIMNIGVVAQKPEGLDKFINRIADIYIEESKKEKVDSAENKIVFLEQEKKKIQEEIIKKNNDIKKITQELATGNLNQEDTPYKAEMKVQETASIEAENERIKKEKEYLQLTKNLEALKEIPIETDVQEKINSDDVVNEQKKLIYSKLEDINKELLLVADKNEMKKELEKKLEEYKKKLKDIDEEAKKKYTKIINRENEYEVNKKLLNAKMEYEAAKQYEEEVKKSYSELKKKYSESSKKVLSGGNITEEIANLRSNLEKVDEKLIYLSGEKNSEGRTSIENYANGSTIVKNTKTFKKIMFAFGFSFGWILFVVIIYEILDKRVKSVEELKNAIGIKPSWPISKLENNDFLNVSLENNGNIQSKALGSLAVKLNDERLAQKIKVVAFSGVTEKSGVTEIVINTAHYMKGKCSHVLLVEMNSEKPSICEKIGIVKDEKDRMHEFMNGEDINKCVYKDEKRNIDILPYDEDKKLDSKEINLIIDRARNEYDIILLDTAPVLKSYITEQIFLKADIIALVVNGNMTKYSEINKTLEIIEKLNVKSMTLVLNWLGKIK